jgi:hypothetical protein
LTEAAEATWVESVDQIEVSEGLSATLQVNEAGSLYVKGDRLLRIMGWLPDMYLGRGNSAALNLPIEVRGSDLASKPRAMPVLNLRCLVMLRFIVTCDSARRRVQKRGLIPYYTIVQFFTQKSHGEQAFFFSLAEHKA